jgi:hypothetical protein
MNIVGHKSEQMHRRDNGIFEGDLLKAASKLNTDLTPTDSAFSSSTGSP